MLLFAAISDVYELLCSWLLGTWLLSEFYLVYLVYLISLSICDGAGKYGPLPFVAMSSFIWIEISVVIGNA